MWGTVSTTAAGILIPVGQGYAAAANAAKSAGQVVMRQAIAQSIVYEVGKDTIAGMAGYGAAQAGAWGGTALFGEDAGRWIGLGSGFLAGLLTAKGIDGLNAKYNLNGLAPLGVPNAVRAQGPISGLDDAFGDVGQGQHISGLSADKIDEIVNTPQGLRPNPADYLSDEYISQHLSYFEDGVVKIQTDVRYHEIGMPGEKTFVMPKDVADDLIRQANGDVRELERLLNLEPAGCLGDNPVRIDIPNPKGLEIPSGNERGANNAWLPGGYTQDGIMEAVIESVPAGEYEVGPVF